MKKNIFLVLTASLFILVLFYFYDEREEILNKEYRDYKNNIYIDYPYFNNITIDAYINELLTPFKLNNSNEKIFIDYDYKEESNLINLILYIYEETKNTVKKYNRKIEIDTINNKILENNRTIDVSIEYDIINQKIININKPMIALTFDDGPNHNTNRVLDILEKYNAKATFFILGTNIKGNEKTIKRMEILNMEIANHMMSHKLLTKLDNDTIIKEIEEVDNLIYNITNKYPNLIRPSYGTINSRIKQITNKPIILWNIDTLDWKNHSSKKIANKVLTNISDGDIILMHDIYRATANSLEIIIPSLQEEGYQLVTVSELMYYKGIKPEKGKVYTNIN